MKRARLAQAMLLLLLAGCSSELLVLERLPPGPGEPTGDADVDVGPARPDAGQESDGGGALDGGGQPPPERDSGAEPDAASGPRRERVVSAFTQTCAVRDRVLFCWGNDATGQVGVAGDAGQLRPVRIDPGEFVDVCTGEYHSCALRADGAALCWGDNTHGQLGVGDFRMRELPTELSARRFNAIACGGRNSCGLSRGDLFCWGDNVEGRLGQGDAPPQTAGTLPDSNAPLAVLPALRFTQVSLGQGHVCAIRDDGALYCWGRNNVGQLGVRDMATQLRTPTELEPGLKFSHVATGQRHSCAIDVDGKLFCWGDNQDPSSGLLGLNTDQPVVRTPALVGDASDYTSVEASWFHSCAMKKSGSLVCWGRNEEGQLGLGDMMPRTTPTRTGPELAWRSVGVGQFHTCAFGREGLSCWGANDTGQLGHGDDVRRYVPIRVSFP